MPPIEGTGATDTTSRAEEVNEFLDNLSYEEAAGLTAEELAARIDAIVAALPEDEREDFVQDFAEEFRDDNNAYEDRIRALIRELNARARRGTEAMRVEAEALVAELNALLDAREEFTDTLNDAVRDAVENYDDTHLDASEFGQSHEGPLDSNGDNAVVEGGELEEPAYDIEMTGHRTSDTPFGDGEYQLTDEEWLIENGYINDDGERQLKPNSETYWTQEEIERALAQRELERLNEQQRVEFNLEPTQTIRAASHDGANGGTDVWIITDEDGTEHVITVRNANDVISVIAGGRTRAVAKGSNLEGVENWDEGMQHRTYRRGSMNSYYDELNGTRFDDSIEDYDFAGSEDLRTAPDRIEEFTGGLPAGHRDEYEAAVNRLFQAIEEGYTEAEIQEMWQDMISHGLPRDVLINLIVAFLRYGGDNFQTLFGGISRPVIERALWDGTSNISQEIKLAILILETQLAGDGEYPLEEILAHGTGTPPTEGSWKDQTENLAALRQLRQLPGANTETINALIAAEEALVARATEVDGEGGRALISDRWYNHIANNASSWSESFDMDYTITDWEEDEWVDGAASASTMAAWLVELFSQIREGEMSYAEMATAILDYSTNKSGGDRDNFACMVVWVLDNMGILDDLMAANRGFAVGMFSIINDGGDRPIGGWDDGDTNLEFGDSNWDAKEALGLDTNVN